MTISLPYSEGPLEEMDIPEDGLSMWYFDAESGTWTPVAGSMVQREAHRVVANVTHTGQFAIFDAPVMMLETDSDGGCVSVPVLPGGGGPLDPTLPALVGLVLAYLMHKAATPCASSRAGVRWQDIRLPVSVRQGKETLLPENSWAAPCLRRRLRGCRPISLGEPRGQARPSRTSGRQAP